jgi:hypothetical protein
MKVKMFVTSLHFFSIVARPTGIESSSNGFCSQIHALFGLEAMKKLVLVGINLRRTQKVLDATACTSARMCMNIVYEHIEPPNRAYVYSSACMYRVLYIFQ